MHSRRKFRSQTSDNMDKWKSRGGKSQIREEQKTEDQRRERVRRKNMEAREKVEKSRFTVSCGSGGSKSRLTKAAVAEPPGQIKDEKLHTVVARSTFGSQNVQNTPKLWCRKKARRCVAKHISKSKCTKHTMFGPLLEVEMSKKCTPLWREAHFEVKMSKTHQVRATFGSWDGEKVHAVVARTRKVEKTEGFGPLLDVRMPFCVAGIRDSAPCQKTAKREGFVAVSTTTAATLQSTTLHYNYSPLHYIPLTTTTTTTTTTLHDTTLHYTATLD